VIKNSSDRYVRKRYRIVTVEQNHRKLALQLDELVTLHRELIAIEQEKITLVIDQNWLQLDEKVEKSGLILERIEETEGQRQETIGRIGGGVDMSLSDLVQLLPADIREELLGKGKTLRKLILKLKNLNLRCEQLISSSLEVLDFTLSLLAGTGSKSKIYSDGGEEQNGEGEQPSLVFDIKA
jgi:hypothetical protein